MTRLKTLNTRSNLSEESCDVMHCNNCVLSLIGVLRSEKLNNVSIPGLYKNAFPQPLSLWVNLHPESVVPESSAKPSLGCRTGSPGLVWQKQQGIFRLTVIIWKRLFSFDITISELVNGAYIKTTDYWTNYPNSYSNNFRFLVSEVIENCGCLENQSSLFIPNHVQITTQRFHINCMIKGHHGITWHCVEQVYST